MCNSCGIISSTLTLPYPQTRGQPKDDHARKVCILQVTSNLRLSVRYCAGLADYEEDNRHSQVSLPLIFSVPVTAPVSFLLVLKRSPNTTDPFMNQVGRKPAGSVHVSSIVVLWATLTT